MIRHQSDIVQIYCSIYNDHHSIWVLNCPYCTRIACVFDQNRKDLLMKDVWSSNKFLCVSDFCFCFYIPVCYVTWLCGKKGIAVSSSSCRQLGQVMDIGWRSYLLHALSVLHREHVFTHTCPMILVLQSTISIVQLVPDDMWKNLSDNVFLSFIFTFISGVRVIYRHCTVHIIIPSDDLKPDTSEFGYRSFT